MQNKVKTEIIRMTLNKPNTVFTNKSFDPTLINFIFGTNGTGKSTISRMLALPDNPDLEFAQPKDDATIMVYNEDYIRDNVQSYGNIPGVFTLTKQNAEKKKEIDDNIAAQRKLQGQIKRNGDALQENDTETAKRESEYVAKVWKETQELRHDKYPETLVGYKNDKKKFFRDLRTYQAVEHSEQELDRLYELAYKDIGEPLKEFKPVTLQLPSDGADLLGSQIVPLSETPYAGFLKDVGNSDWVREGFRDYQKKAGNRCPYCGQPLDAEHFAEELAAVFDDRYQKAITALHAFCERYGTAVQNAQLTLHHNPEYEGSLGEKYKSLVEKFMLLSDGNTDKLTDKMMAPATPMQIDNRAMLETLDEINATIAAINKEIRKYNALLSDPTKKKKCTEAVWEEMAYVCRTQYSAFDAAMKELRVAKAKLDKTASALKTQDEQYTTTIKALNQQTVNTTVAKDNINRLLHSAGFQGFELVEKPGAQYVYQLVRTDNAGKKTVASNLSEGERNFIAFLYYYQTVIGSQSDDGIKRHKIVVIDDPVSSMDSSTLYLVASLVRNLISICYNNYDISEETGRDDYIKQFFCLTHNPYFFREITYNCQDKYECVSFFQLKKGPGNQSDIQPSEKEINTTPKTTVNESPVKNVYDSLWHEFMTTDDPMITMNTARRILEYYFLQVNGKKSLRKLIDEHKENFLDHLPDGTTDTRRYDLAMAMVSFLDTSFNDSLYFDASAVKPEQYREVFKDIFDSLGQDEHYEMMSRRAR